MDHSRWHTFNEFGVEYLHYDWRHEYEIASARILTIILQ